jgi:hypothetical protein
MIAGGFAVGIGGFTLSGAVGVLSGCVVAAVLGVLVGVEAMLAGGLLVSKTSGGFSLVSTRAPQDNTNAGSTIIKDLFFMGPPF